MEGDWGGGRGGFGRDGAGRGGRVEGQAAGDAARRSQIRRTLIWLGSARVTRTLEPTGMKPDSERAS